MLLVCMFCNVTWVCFNTVLIISHYLREPTGFSPAFLLSSLCLLCFSLQFQEPYQLARAGGCLSMRGIYSTFDRQGDE